ncbi:hypothetical protein [Moraxella caprae]|nr:hypothetical protein [Moraxella caprae]
MAIILLCVFAFAVPIYFLADWHTLIKWVALGMLSSLIPLCIYLTLQSRQIIHQDAQGITIKIGLWRIKTVRIDYQDIIAVTDIYLPAKRYKNPPTILQISYHHKNTIYQQNINLCRHDAQIWVDFQMFLLHKKIFNQVLYQKSAILNLPQTFNSRYYLVGFCVVAGVLAVMVFLFYIAMGVYHFNELSPDAQIHLFVLVAFLIFIIKLLIDGIKFIAKSGTITLHPDHLLIKTIFNKEIIIKLYLLNYENIKTDISDINVFQKFSFNDVRQDFILINHHSHAQAVQDFFKRKSCQVLRRVYH